jgi:hypothetical protein
MGCLRIAPRIPSVRFDAPLLRVETDPNGNLHGEYRPITEGTLCLALGSPETIKIVPMQRGVPIAF